MKKQLPQFIEKHRDEIKRLAEKNGLTNVRVFGSMARGEGTPDSDIDLLVDKTEGWDGLSRAGLRIDVRELTGRQVDVATEKNLPEMLKDEILEDCVAL